MKEFKVIIFDVNEALPPIGERVICFTEGETEIGVIINHAYEDKKDVRGYDLNSLPIWEINGNMTKKPTHWMEIPKVDPIK